MNDHISRKPIHEKDVCNLYALTFSPIGMKKEWKRFIQNLGIPATFMPRDEFSTAYHHSPAAFPAIYLEEGGVLTVFLDREEINRTSDLEELISLVRQHLVR